MHTKTLRFWTQSTSRYFAGMNYNWIVAQEGSRQSYAVPEAFQVIDKLRMFYTDVWCRNGHNWLLKGPKPARAWAGRYNARIPGHKVESFDLAGLLRLAGRNLRRSGISAGELADYYIRFGTWFATETASRVNKLQIDPVTDCFFGFDTTCLETLRVCKERGIFTIVDQVDPALVEEDMVAEEAARWPGWERVPGRMPETYWQRLRAEWEMADAVLVNSPWSRDALLRQGVSESRIMVVPLAIHLPPDKKLVPVNPEGPLKVIWLGSIILRKGIQYLVEAARLLNNEKIEFLLAGPVGISPDALKSFPANIKLVGRITRDSLNQIYSQGHVFVLPTISDGFAITQLEAMSHGLPVVTTPNCGRVVTDGDDGLIVPARNALALAEALARLDRDRALLLRMSRKALETVQQYDLPSNALLICEETARRHHCKHRAS
jgi:glycosyltransferase involved in cell wall biosynthesis